MIAISEFKNDKNNLETLKGLFAMYLTPQKEDEQEIGRDMAQQEDMANKILEYER